jgi:hypothetical protein
MDASKCWSIEEFQGWNKVSVKDRIDSFNYEPFAHDLRELLKSSPKPLALEVSRVRFLSLKTIQLLNEIAGETRAKGLRAALIAPSEKLKRQIDIYAELERWEVFRSMPDLEANHAETPAYRAESPFASL